MTVAFRGDADRTSLRHLLRHSTTDLHAAVDARFASLLDDRESYREFLQQSAAAVYPLEHALVAANVSNILPDWHERSRTMALRDDLTELGVDHSAAVALPALGGEAYQLGVLYVLEGSRLGARVVARRAFADSAPRIRQATRYLRHGEGKNLWGTFLERLELSDPARRNPGDAIAGARAAFLMFCGTSAAASCRHPVPSTQWTRTPTPVA